MFSKIIAGGSLVRELLMNREEEGGQGASTESEQLAALGIWGSWAPPPSMPIQIKARAACVGQCTLPALSAL